MKLNLYLLEHELGELVVKSDLHSDAAAPRLDYPVFYKPDEQEFQDNILYIASESQLREVRPHVHAYLQENPDLVISFLCIGTPPDPYKTNEQCDILWIDPEVELISFFNQVQEVFQGFDAWEDDLNGIVQSGGTVQDLVKASVNVVKNDICIISQFSKVISHQVYINKRLTKEQTNCLKEGEDLPKDMVYDGIEDEQAGESFKTIKPVFSHMKAFDCDVIRTSITTPQNDTLVLSFHPNFQDVGLKDYAALIVLADNVRQIFSSYSTLLNNENYTSTHSTLRLLLLRKRVAEVDLMQCTISLGWSIENDDYLCICVDFIYSREHSDSSFVRPFISICNEIQNRLGCVSFVLDSRIIAIANITQLGTTADELMAQFARFIDDYHLLAGASAVYRGIKNLPGAFRQSFAALRKGYVSHEARQLYRFEDYALEIGMNFIIKELTPEYYCPVELIALAEDEPELAETLETYLNNNCSASAASKKLFISRNSFIYRLNKIKQKLGKDLDDPDVRLLLLISFKLIALYGLHPKDNPEQLR